MKISYTLTKEDNQKYISTDFERNKFNPRKVIMILVIIIFSFLGLMFLMASDYLLGAIMIAVAVLYAYLLIGYPKRVKRKYLNQLNSSGELDETRTIEVNENELKIISPSKTSIHNYSSLAEISSLKNNFVIITFKDTSSIAVPPSAFSNDEDRIEFINKIRTNAKIL